MSIDQLLENQPEASVILEHREASIEIPAQVLSDNGYGSRELTNPQSAGPFLPVNAEELSALNELV